MITHLLFSKMWWAAEKKILFSFLFEKKMELNWNDTHSQRLNERSGGDENKSTCNRAHARTPSLKAALHFLFFFFDFIHFSFSCHILFSIHFSVVGLKLTDVLVSELIIKFVAASYTAQHNKQQQHFFGFCGLSFDGFCQSLTGERADDWAGSKVCGNLMHSFKMWSSRSYCKMKRRWAIKRARRDETKTKKSELYAYEMEQITEFIVIACVWLCWLTYLFGLQWDEFILWMENWSGRNNLTNTHTHFHIKWL